MYGYRCDLHPSSGLHIIRMEKWAINRLPARCATIHAQSRFCTALGWSLYTHCSQARTLPLPRTYMRHAHLLSLAAWVFEKHLEPGLPRLCFTFYLSRFEQGVEFLDSIFPCKHLSIALPGRLSDLFCEPLPWFDEFFDLFIYKTRLQKQICNLFLLIGIFWPSEPAR